MPNIVEYNATGEITPSDKGIQAAEVAGRRLGQFGSETAAATRATAENIGRGLDSITDAVEKHMAVMETSELYKTGEELKANLQQKYEAESALPENRNDPHFGDRFMAEAGPLIDEWGHGAHTDHGRLLAAEMGANIRNEVFRHVASGQSEMDSAHVQDNGTQTMNMLGSGLITDPSETNLDRTLGTAKDAIQGMTMAIPDVATRERVALELSQQYLPNLVIARYQGVATSIKNQIAETGADTSPALEQLNKDLAKQVGFEHLKPEQQTALSTLRDEAVRQGQELFKAKDAAQRKKDSDDFDAALLPIEVGMFKPNGAGGVTMAVGPDTLDAVQRAALMPGAKQHPERIEALLNAMHTATQDQLAGKETTTDHSAYVDLSSRIGSTTNPLTKAEVDTMRAEHRLSDTDYHFLREAASDSKSANPKINHALTEMNQFLERIKPVVDKSSIYSGVDQGGAVKFSQLSWDATDKLRKAIASGEDPEAAVVRLTDPRNPNGIYSILPQYQTTNKQGMANVLEAIKPDSAQAIPAPPGGMHGPVPRKPNESPADYLKRTNQ